MIAGSARIIPLCRLGLFIRKPNVCCKIFICSFSDRMNSTPSTILVSPWSSLIDQKVEICVSGLGNRQHVTLHASVLGDAKETFESHAHYIADEEGKVVMSRDASCGGSYAGVESMGFLWSMKPAPGQRRGLRLMKKDVTKPYKINLNCFDGHLDPEGGFENSLSNGVLQPTASVTCEKWYMADGVQRIPVREGRVRGTLFLPPGDGPFPGVIDLLGTAGGLNEFKAALLASHGFAALSLAFFGFDDLPKYLENCEMEYFEEAAEWLMTHPSVIPQGVGLMGVSKGSEIVLMLAAHRSDIVKAVVPVSPSCYISVVPFKHKGKLTGSFYNSSKAKKNEQGEYIFRDCGLPVPGDNFDPTARIPVEKINCPVLLVFGLDDQDAAAPEMAQEIQDRLMDHGKGVLCRALGYPGTGHLIEPPYAPHCYASYHKLFKLSFVWGGNAKEHSQAQEQSWRNILEFFNKNLGRNLNSHL